MDLNYVEYSRRQNSQEGNSPVKSVTVIKILSQEIVRDKQFFYKTKALPTNFVENL